MRIKPTWLLLLLLPTGATALADSHCFSMSSFDDLSSIPIDWSIDYETEVQPIFTLACLGCHSESQGSVAVGLRLDSGVSHFDLVDVQSPQITSWVRVKPFQPEQSLLYSKLNCVDPVVGVRMPIGGALTLADQAKIYDWIKLGANAGFVNPDLITRASFETRD